ncbi:hypothetical protein ACLKA6_006030 [Drosophila palustris]
MAYALSTIARLFDPMGWLSPIVLTAKMLMQVLWKTKLKWDSWDKFVKEMPNIASKKYPDTLQGAPQTTLDNYISSAMHLPAHMVLRRIYAYQQKMDIFTLKKQGHAGEATTDYTSSRIMCSRSNVNFAETMFCSDSVITLGWIRSGSARLKTFVANRINKIL